MRFRDNKNPTGATGAPRPRCPECNAEGGGHQQVRVSKQRESSIGGTSAKYDIVWESCPRAGGKGGKR